MIGLTDRFGSLKKRWNEKKPWSTRKAVLMFAWVILLVFAVVIGAGVPQWLWRVHLFLGLVTCLAMIPWLVLALEGS